MATVPIALVHYDPDWPRRFEAERALLARILGDTVVSFEHVGSTAVPGLGAKPIIDIMAGVSSLAEVEACIHELEANGYEYVPEYEVQIPERRYLRKPRVGPRTHHLHAVVVGSAFWSRHLAFRNYLRAHPEAAAAYLQLKQQLASRHRADTAAYTEGKSSFVESILGKAAAEGGAAQEAAAAAEQRARERRTR